MRNRFKTFLVIVVVVTMWLVSTILWIFTLGYSANFFGKPEDSDGTFDKITCGRQPFR